MTAHYGLIGYPLTHSFSPTYFANKFRREHIDAAYNLFPITSIDLFPELLQSHRNLRGLNVTIPYKETICGYLDELDATAREIAAVNCITITNGKTKGYNTDVIGFSESLRPLLQPHHKNALILGTGGASLAVAYSLDIIGIPYQKVSRSTGGALGYDELTPELIEASLLIINTTPVGMYPHAEEMPNIPYESVGKHHLLYDLIYNPAQTKFLQQGIARGAATKNGLEMLELQAAASWEIWNA